MNETPIALFVYNRPQHTACMVDSLLRNQGIDRHPVYVFSDAPLSVEQEQAVSQTRSVVRDKLPRAEVIEQPVNVGVANSCVV